MILYNIDFIDYNLTSTHFNFKPTDDNQTISSTVVSIPIISDDNNECEEAFNLTIEVSDEARAANITEGTISTTMVIIKDDDGKT